MKSIYKGTPKQRHLANRLRFYIYGVHADSYNVSDEEIIERCEGSTPLQLAEFEMACVDLVYAIHRSWFGNFLFRIARIFVRKNVK